MFQQQPMRNQPGPQMPQRPGRALMPRHPGMRMQPPQAQQRGLQQMFQPMGAAQEQAGARGAGGIQGLLSKILPGSAASGEQEQASAEPEAALEAFRVLPIRLPFQTCSAMFKKRSV